jgi:hypothetical protein
MFAAAFTVTAAVAAAASFSLALGKSVGPGTQHQNEAQ